ncbi:MAG: hypothetical protein J6M60_00300 [Clostridia bacterium]|nr:hypothetical protein [Clostridia bacterium]
MEKLNFTNMVEDLLGHDLYIKFLTEITKEYKSDDIVRFGSDVVERCCLIIIMIGMSNKIKMDKVKIILADKIVEVSCREFAKKYAPYAKAIESNLPE